MSKTHTADGKRRSSMTHAQRSWRCSCGAVVSGNGGKSSHKAMHERRGEETTWQRADRSFLG